MNKSEIINESPQDIILDKAEVHTSEAEIKNNINNSTLVKEYSKTVSLFHLIISKNKSYYFLYNKVNKQVDYFVKYSKVEFSPKVLPVNNYGIRQVLVHRDSRSSGYTPGFAKSVFWEYLWTKNNCLVSDSQQSDDGRGFWHFVIKDAIEKSLTVRVVNTNDNTYKDYTSYDEIILDQDKIWGGSRWFQRMIIAIF